MMITIHITQDDIYGAIIYDAKP